MLSQSARGINKISRLKGRLTKRAHLLAITTQGRPSRSTCRPSPPDWVPLDHLIFHLRRDINLPENRHYSSSQLPVTIVLGPRWCEGWSRDRRRHMKSERQVVSRGWQAAWVLQSVADPCDCQPVHSVLACVIANQCILYWLVLLWLPIIVQRVHTASANNAPASA